MQVGLGIPNTCLRRPLMGRLRPVGFWTIGPTSGRRAVENRHDVFRPKRGQLRSSDRTSVAGATGHLGTMS